MKLYVHHCALRGEELEPVKVVDVTNEAAAKRYIAEIPVKKGFEYYYGILYQGEDKVLIDPTFNQRYNLQQRFIKAVLNDK